MPKFKIVIDGKCYKKWHGRSFGPFNSPQTAAEELERRGWFKNNTRGEDCLWSVSTHEYNLIDARVAYALRSDEKTPENPRKLPTWMCEKQRRSKSSVRERRAVISREEFKIHCPNCGYRVQ